MTTASEGTVAVCICTRNRPDELRNALDSLARSRYPIAQIIVSDDSTDDRTAQMLADPTLGIRYLGGPRRGLGANRNNALGAVASDRVLFIDDDVELGADYLSRAFAALASVDAAAAARTIVTGIETQYGTPVEPKDQDFLGFQRLAYRGDDALHTVVINSALFPAGLFERVRFDEQLVYGCDEVDFTTRACAAGYRIVLRRDAVNAHFPSSVNRDFYDRFRHASRLYVTFKRYWSTERRPLRALAFAALAPLHLLLHGWRKERFAGIARTAQSLGIALGYLRRAGTSAPLPVRTAEAANGVPRAA